MPSGITADIYEGKDVTLRDYLMRVGRGMGYAILQRDDDPSEPVKTTTESSSYYEQRIPELKAQLAALWNLTDDEIAEAARADYQERHDAWERRRTEKAALRERYEDMLAQVEAWEPDPLIASTKEYAIKYLRESIDFDCGGSRFDQEPQPQDPADWLAAQKEDVSDSLARAEAHWEEEKERTADRNRHIEAFLRSLPPEVVPA